MDQTAKDRLTALSELYKQQKFKLPKPELEEAANLLAQGFVASLGPNHDTIDQFVRALPADSTAKALSDSWDRLSDDAKNHLHKSLLTLPRTDRFDRLKLLAAAVIGEKDRARGLSFLCSACSSLESKSGTVSGEVLQAFRKTFMDGHTPRLESLQITVHASAATAALLNIAIQALFNNSPTLAPVFQLPTVKWLFNSQGYSRLKPAHQTQLIEAIKRWEPTLQAEVRNVLDAISSGIPSGFEFLLAPTPKLVPAQTVHLATAPADSPLAQPESRLVHWKELLAELQSQIAKMDQDLQATREQSETATTENAKLKTSLASAESHADTLKTELTKKAEANEKAAAAMSAAQTAAAIAKQSNEALQSQVDELKRNHEQEATILLSRVNTEASQRLETFKHDLARVLRVDYADFKLTDGKPMTVELGQALRDLLASIFDHLQKQGINVKD